MQMYLFCIIGGSVTLFGLEPYAMKTIITPTSPDIRYVRYISACCALICSSSMVHLILEIMNKNKTAIGKQTIFHHTLVCVIGGCALYGGFAMPKLMQIAFLCELSGPFLAIREFKGKNEWTGPWALLNNITFFLTYTFARIILFPMVSLAQWRETNTYDYASQSDGHKLCFWVCLLSFLSLIVLNLYWY